MKRFLSTSVIFVALSSGVVLKAGPPQPNPKSPAWPRVCEAPSVNIFVQLLQFLNL